MLGCINQCFLSSFVLLKMFLPAYPRPFRRCFFTERTDYRKKRPPRCLPFAGKCAGYRRNVPMVLVVRGIMHNTHIGGWVVRYEGFFSLWGAVAGNGCLFPGFARLWATFSGYNPHIWQRPAMAATARLGGGGGAGLLPANFLRSVNSTRRRGGDSLAKTF